MLIVTMHIKKQRIFVERVIYATVYSCVYLLRKIQSNLKKVGINFKFNSPVYAFCV